MQTSRRKFMKQVGVTSLAFAGASLFNSQAIAATSSPTLSFGKVVLTKKGSVTIHTYIAPEASALVTSHIIETQDSLVMVDSQMVQPAVDELKAYIASLGKPLERLILSHEHPDHWLGSGNFDAPYMTTVTIAQNVEASYDVTLERMSGTLGEIMPAGARIPEGTLATGSEVIGGVEMIFTSYQDAEAPEHLVIQIPEAGAIIVQDLIYNNAHFFPLGNNANWIGTLEAMRLLQEEGYDTLLVGHGMPSSFGELDEAISYLNVQNEILSSASSADEAISALVERYPSYGGNALLGFVALRFA